MTEEQRTKPYVLIDDEDAVIGYYDSSEEAEEAARKDCIEVNGIGSEYQILFKSRLVTFELEAKSSYISVQ